MARGKKEPAVETEKPAEEKTARARKPRTTTAKKPRAKKASTTSTKRKKKETAKAAETVEAELVVAEKGPKRGGVGVNGNLIPMNQRTKSEQREIACAGGKASGEKRRNQKSLREFGQEFLMQASPDLYKDLMSRYEVVTDDQTNLAALFVRLFSKAMNTGDMNAARQVIEWAGMAPLQEMRENEAIAKMSQVVQLAQQSTDQDQNADDELDVVFYIPDNGRAIITDNEPAAAAVSE